MMIAALEWFFHSPIAMMSFMWVLGAITGYAIGRRQGTMAIEAERDQAIHDLECIKRAVSLVSKSG